MTTDPPSGPVRSTQRGGETATRRPEFKWLARAGLIARGVVYGVVGLLALKLARGAGGKTTSQQGALKTIAHEPFGQGLLIAVTVGLAGYAIWRLVEEALTQLGMEFGTRDDGTLVIPTPDGGPIFVAADTVTYEEGPDWPVLQLLLPILEDVDSKQVDMDVLALANEMSPSGSVVLLREAKMLGLWKDCVGWPGTAEYQAMLDIMVFSAAAVEEFLAGRISGSAPPRYSDLVA